MRVEELNVVDESAFVRIVGPLFEHSPWIAAAAAAQRPFADAASLYAALTRIVRAASEERRVALIAAHPDLAGRLAREGRLTAASRDEQSAAGLDTLSEDERREFAELNDAYTARFGFPFVICAREHDKQSIVRAMRERLANERSSEIATAIEEIAKIAKLRLADLLEVPA